MFCGADNWRLCLVADVSHSLPLCGEGQGWGFSPTGGWIAPLANHVRPWRLHSELC
jgi:hypothetical protein